MTTSLAVGIIVVFVISAGFAFFVYKDSGGNLPDTISAFLFPFVTCTAVLSAGLYDDDWTTRDRLDDINEINTSTDNVELSMMISEALKDGVLRRSEYSTITNFKPKYDVDGHVKTVKANADQKMIDFVKTLGETK